MQLAAYPPPRFTWYVNGVAIQQSQRHKVTYDNGVVTLIIFNAQPQDSGEYVLKVTNDLGETTCKTVLTISREYNERAHVYSVHVHVHVHIDNQSDRCLFVHALFYATATIDARLATGCTVWCTNDSVRTASGRASFSGLYLNLSGLLLLHSHTEGGRAAHGDTGRHHYVISATSSAEYGSDAYVHEADAARDSRPRARHRQVSSSNRARLVTAHLNSATSLLIASHPLLILLLCACAFTGWKRTLKRTHRHSSRGM